MSFSDAVETAVEHCIQNGILEEFLTKNRAEAIAMSIFEYNEEQHLKSEREQAYQKRSSYTWRIIYHCDKWMWTDFI